jgi:polysaccharide export outer membrane protein
MQYERMKTVNSMKIFVVDDDEFCLSLYEQQIYSLGYTDVSTFKNGHDCIENLNLKPDIILLDHSMEDFNGYEILKKIKKINPDIYVVILSGQEDFSVISDTLHLGAFDFIVKSNKDIVNIQSVFEKIEAAKHRVKKINHYFL